VAAFGVALAPAFTALVEAAVAQNLLPAGTTYSSLVAVNSAAFGVANVGVVSNFAVTPSPAAAPATAAASTNIGAIVGGTVGAAALVIIVAGSVLFVRRQAAQKAAAVAAVTAVASTEASASDSDCAVKTVAKAEEPVT
jgi:hypothetical protein